MLEISYSPAAGKIISTTVSIFIFLVLDSNIFRNRLPLIFLHTKSDTSIKSTISNNMEINNFKNSTFNVTTRKKNAKRKNEKFQIYTPFTNTDTHTIRCALVHAKTIQFVERKNVFNFTSNEISIKRLF